MVIFENGTLLENAYVEINGVKYPVHMPKYSGNTPVSAENLNKMQDDLQEEINKVKGTILYEDETGTNGDVPLNENGTNYKEFEVFGYRSDRSLYAKVDTKRKYFTFEDIRYDGDNFYFYTKEYYIDEYTLKMQYSKLMYTGSDGTNAMGDDTGVYITKVIGHN